MSNDGTESGMSGESWQKDHAGHAAHLLYSAARYALEAGWTRKEWDVMSGFWWGQAVPDHAQKVAEDALTESVAAGRGER